MEEIPDEYVAAPAPAVARSIAGVVPPELDTRPAVPETDVTVPVPYPAEPVTDVTRHKHQR
jgi:hypothetical protein